MSDQDSVNHARTRKNVLLELKKICASSKKLSVKDTSKETQDSLSPITDCLLELNPPELRELAAENFNCYRCKHFLQLPQNFHRSLDRITERVDRFEDDLEFVQAIVWLRSAVQSRKEISLDQFQSIFRRQWASVEEDQVANTPKVDQDQPELSSGHSYEGTLKETLTGMTEELIMQCEREMSVADIELLLDNGSYEAENDLSRINEICSVAETVLSGVVSDLSSQRRFAVEADVEKRIIPETDDESCSDIFRDSSDSEINRNRGSLRDTFLDSEDDRSESDIFLDKNDSLDRTKMGDFVVEDTDSEALTSCGTSLTRNHEKVCDLFENQPGDWSFELQSQITSSLTGDRSFILTCASFRQGSNSQTENIFDLSRFEPAAPDDRRKVDDSAYDTLTLTNSYQYPPMTIINDGGSRNDRETITPMSSSRNEKKRKLKLSFGFPPGNERKKRRTILSSEWLSFVFGSLNTDEIVFDSMRIILSFFEDERISRDYAKRRRWNNTLEREAVNAILNLCDVFDAEKKTSVYSQEVVQTVIRTLERIIGTAGQNEATPSTFHLSIILEFCNSMEVCTKVMDHLAAKLKSYERRLVSLLNGGHVDMHKVVNELHLVFYALSISLDKYRLVIANIGEQISEDSITPVVDLWKKQFSDSEDGRKESRKSREQRWTKIFEEFGAFACEDFVQFAEKARILCLTMTAK